MKRANEQMLIRTQVSKKLETTREVFHTLTGIHSWSRYIRNTLGMSVSQLAKRLKIHQSSASRLEKREVDQTLTIKKLRQMADAMECDLAYAFIPRKTIDEIVFRQAKEKALKSIEQSDTHMSLENQKVTTDFKERLENLIKEKMYSKYLWDKNE